MSVSNSCYVPEYAAGCLTICVVTLLLIPMSRVSEVLHKVMLEYKLKFLTQPLVFLGELGLISIIASLKSTPDITALRVGIVHVLRPRSQVNPPNMYPKVVIAPFQDPRALGKR